MACLDGMVSGMRSVWLVARKGIFKRKSYTFAIFFLTLVAALCMSTGFSTIFRTQQIYDAAYEKSGAPDLYYIYQQKNYSDDYLAFFRARKEVKSVRAVQSLFSNGAAAALNGSDLANTVFDIYGQSQGTFTLTSGAAALTDHSAYLPILYQTLYGAKQGGTFTVKSGSGTLRFTIAGFFEDPLYGSSFTGNKRILFSTGGYENVKTLTLGKTTALCTVLSVYLKAQYRGGALEQSAKAINTAFGKDTVAAFQTDSTLYSQVVLIIPRLLSVVLLCFAGLLLIVVILVLRHAILSSIEADYVSLGVYKALGFTGRDILLSILLQYLMVVICGTAAGIAGAVFATPAVAGVLMTSTGILGTVGLTLPAALGVPAGLLLLSGGIAAATAARAARVSPMRAISFGKAPVHFSSRLNPPLARLRRAPLWLALPVKQMATRLRQYVTLIVVAALFTFMLSTVQMLTTSFNSTDKAASLLGQTLNDVDIGTADPAVASSGKLDEIVRDIDTTYGIKSVTWYEEVNLRADDTALYAYIRDGFSELQGAMLEGQTPAFENEIAVTPLVSRLLGKGVGDTVTLQKGDAKETYLITCILQTTNEMGKVIQITEAGYKRLVPGFQPGSRSIVLKNAGDTARAVKALKAKYPSATGVTVTNARKSWQESFSTVQTAIGLASVLVTALTLLLIACVTALLCSITLYREVIDTGIFKAIGFRTMGLRCQFTLRFMLVSAVGGAVGTVLALLFANPLISKALSSIGIAKVPAALDFATLGFPILFVLCVAGVTALICSARIRRLSPASLISE